MTRLTDIVCNVVQSFSGVVGESVTTYRESESLAQSKLVLFHV